MTSGAVTDSAREWKDQSQTRRKYLQKTHVLKDCYPKYTKTS
jgi:hypothetical protein